MHAQNCHSTIKKEAKLRFYKEFWKPRPSQMQS